ncbi:MULTISPECIES: metalloregulator ArsR/SmtB family transcription factor [Arcicella]|uniref:Metalloregulator ArsR/SmtB family transcription factor n=1 Tax=Arcicella aquatica TaxID=217141 RepID=A0ABU5QUW4_9BACT|nr:MULTISPECIES: metalloregulator ArsR/SmtB family transcription factor [Arcicella]MDR6564616.1 DNA-binding transcriptional ArsR family regulator [Arcicella sp. BE51]MDR6814456.1 DNA-binding transcriptional ArsR family regulator [Arcicella sp. BE140]MDR6825788.1 DNA-binding transcriptional ArsR family regulator [Arcicella sp. BE139]MEA5260499.1 metalloregulator ArsR/SmtB family transcription factor [Arcicella aquatica]
MQETTQFIEKSTSAIADSYRLKILLELSQKGEMCCRDVQELIGLSQSTCSHHIALLIESELVESKKEGKFHKISLNRENFKKLSAFFQELS